MTSIFIFISGATLLVYSAEKLIGFLVNASRGLKISVFLLAIIFTGIEFDDIVLGVALSLEGLQEVALGLVLGTAVSFTRPAMERPGLPGSPTPGRSTSVTLTVPTRQCLGRAMVPLPSSSSTT